MNNMKVDIHVDAQKNVKEKIHNWRYFGYDECNYTDTPGGEKLLGLFGGLEDAPYYVRTHHLFCTGNGQGTIKWGSTNVYTEDGDGNPVYTWDTLDAILDGIVQKNLMPFFELGFTPMDLVDPALFDKCDKWSKYKYYINEGHTYPPKDYKKWFELIKITAEHCVNRYGDQNVLKWYWELWNEPDLSFYWRGTQEEYFKLYDYTEAALHSVIPGARLGGPATTGMKPESYALDFFENFLEHCSNGSNFMTGIRGTRLDYITFHVKGGGFSFNLNSPKDTPSIKALAAFLRTGLDVVCKHGYQDREIVLSEADPDGWAAGGMYDNINLNFRNTEYYASYIASSYHHIDKIAELMNLDVRPLAWAFMFIGERCFEGTRTFSTQGIEKASFNAFRILSKMGSKQIPFKSSGEIEILADGDGKTDVSGMATLKEDGSVQVMVYSHHDDWDKKEDINVAVHIQNIPFSGSAIVKQSRIDHEHSNAYHEWVLLNKPHYPTGDRYDQIKAKSGLEIVETSQTFIGDDHELNLTFSSPAHAVSLIELSSL